MTMKTDADGHEEFVNLFEKGLSFTKEILAENERLRFRMATLEAEVELARRQSGTAGPAGDPLVDSLRRQLAELEAERTRLLSSFREVETLNRDYQQRYSEIENEHNNLAHLYIASYQLHSTLSFREVVQVVSEIVINLIGVARFALYLFDGKSELLEPIAAEGVELSALRPIDLKDPIVGKAARTKERYLRDAAAPATGPVAVVPLATLESLVGAIVIDKLLVQKAELSPVDFELFNLLGVHAATALSSALLREQTGPEGQSLHLSRARALLA